MPRTKLDNPISAAVDSLKDAVLSPITGLDPKKNPKYQKFTEDAMRILLSGFERHQNPGNSKQAELIKKWKTRLSSKDLLDEVMCNEMIAELGSFITDEADRKKYQDVAKSSIAKVQSAIEENSKKEDEVWKWQLLQLFAIMTPLGAFSIAGHVFNYLNPLMDLFGPVLGNAGIAQGVADVSTSSQLGPFAKLAEIMRIDDGIKIVLEKTPILSDLIDIVDIITTNENLHLLGNEIVPVLTASEMPLLAIAGAMVIVNLGDNIDHNKKVASTNESAESTLESLQRNMPKPKAMVSPKEPAKASKETIKNSEVNKPSPNPNRPVLDYTKLVSEPGKIDVTDPRGSGITVY